jgi:hypothetical protein
MLAKGKICLLKYPETLWRGVSREGQELVQLMTICDPNSRITLEAALTHSWFTQEEETTSSIGPAIDNMTKHVLAYFFFHVDRL